MELKTLIGICGVALAMTACADEADDGPDFPTEFRTGGGENLALGDFSMHIGETTDEDDCLVWDYQGSVVVNGAATGSGVGDPLAEIIANYTDVVVGGEVRCNVEYMPWWNLALIRELYTNDVLYTVYNGFVFEGALWGLSSQEIQDALVYTWKDDHVYAGEATGTPILTGDANIEDAKYWQKLVTTAAIDGECTMPGLASYPPAHGGEGPPNNAPPTPGD